MCGCSVCCSLGPRVALYPCTLLLPHAATQVLEITWGKLVKDLKAARGLSELIAAHDRYLTRLMQKVQRFLVPLLPAVAALDRSWGWFRGPPPPWAPP